MDTILATKENMQQSFEEGKRVGVTVVNAGPCVVTQVKSQEKDGYWAVQLGFMGKTKKGKVKPLKGHLKKTKLEKMPLFFKEVRLGSEAKIKEGATIKISDVFSPGDIISVTGVGKGKGFAGVVKRWKFAGGPKTHGQSDRHRAPGSIGQGTDPGRVFKGKKMAGRMGGERTTVKGLKVVSIDEKENKLYIAGSVPGTKGSKLVIKKIISKSEDKKQN